MPFPFGFVDNEGIAYDLSDAELAGGVGSAPMRHVGFEYLQRDGGDIQGLGAGIESYSFQCFYTGENYDARLRGLRDAIQRQPKGLLTHKEFGPLRAHCMGIDEYTVEYVRERDTVNFRISFKRDQTDLTSKLSRVPSVPSKSSQLVEQARSASQTISLIAEVATRVAAAPSTIANYAIQLNAQMAGLVNFVDIFTQSAIQAATFGQVDFTLETQRDSIFVQCGSVITTARSLGLPDATLYPSLISVRQVYAQTLELDVLVRTQAPQITTVTIEGRQPLVVFLATQYGSDAIAHLEEVRINNRIGSFGLNPGQQLRIVAPTVQRTN